MSPRPGAGALGAAARRPRDPRAASPPRSPGQAPHLGSKPDFGPLTQFGLRISFARLRQPDAIELLERRGVPAVWRDSIAAHLSQIAALDRRIAPIDSALSPLAGSDARARPLQRIPGVGPLIGLTFAAEIGAVSRFSSASKLVGYAGLAPRISQSGERSQTGRLSKAGPRTLSWAAVEAANQAWRPTNPFHGHYRRLAARHGKNPANSAVARKLLICAWHMLSRNQVFQPTRSTTAAASSARFLAA